MAGKIANSNCERFKDYFLEIQTFVSTKVVAILLKIVLKTSQIQISYFPANFYLVNFNLISVHHFLTNFENLTFFRYFVRISNKKSQRQYVQTLGKK